MSITNIECPCAKYLLGNILIYQFVRPMKLLIRSAAVLVKIDEDVFVFYLYVFLSLSLSVLRCYYSVKLAEYN